MIIGQGRNTIMPPRIHRAQTEQTVTQRRRQSVSIVQQTAVVQCGGSCVFRSEIGLRDTFWYNERRQSVPHPAVGRTGHHTVGSMNNDNFLVQNPNGKKMDKKQMAKDINDGNGERDSARVSVELTQSCDAVVIVFIFHDFMHFPRLTILSECGCDGDGLLQNGDSSAVMIASLNSINSWFSFPHTKILRSRRKCLFHSLFVGDIKIFWDSLVENTVCKWGNLK